MKTMHFRLLALCPTLALALGLPSTSFAGTVKRETIPWDQIGAMAGADYKGDGLSVTPTSDGARLRCTFQRINAEVTVDGMFLSSAVSGQPTDRFQVKAVGMARKSNTLTEDLKLPLTGKVLLDGQTVRFVRPGLVEEYTTSMDGVRQDFVVLEKLASQGELEVKLAVTGATVQHTTSGVQLVLASGRKIVYSRLRVTDATGKELQARIEMPDKSVAGVSKHATSLMVCVNDVGAVYPLRIDPTFSDANWISMGVSPGPGGGASCLAVDASGNLYIGGGFTQVSGVLANGIAKWDGNHWSALGSGVNGAVNALAISGANLYVGGYFTSAGGISVSKIAKWNGSSWSALGSGVHPGEYGDAVVYALAVSGSTLYVGGSFETAGSVTANNIAKWNGSSWSAVNTGIMDGFVYALVVSGSDLYAGGTFYSIGGVSGVNHVAKWNGSSWSALGDGVNGYVHALAVSGTNIYVGGEGWFFTDGVQDIYALGKWDGSQWSGLGAGVSNDFPKVLSLTISGTNLYVGGDFTSAGGMPAPGIAKWDGSNWSTLGSGIHGGVSAIVISNNILYAGGDFYQAGEVIASGLAAWDGSNWSAFGSGTIGSVNALALAGTDLYVAGPLSIGGVVVNGLAKWDGIQWRALGTGFNGYVNALALVGSDLYAGGHFTNVSGIAAANIAKWNGTNWSSLGSGLTGPQEYYMSVKALAVMGSDLYVGGEFTHAGGILASNIARWNGSTWSALGPGVGDTVDALAVMGGALYTMINKITADGYSYVLFRWNGSSWAEFYGLDGFVSKLAVMGNDLYASGNFLRTGSVFSEPYDVAVTNIAKWDGSAWSAVGSGLRAVGFDDYSVDVADLVASEDKLYAAGYFSVGNGAPTEQIAEWDGTNWTSVGSVDYYLYALAVSTNDLYAGGSFTMIGGKVSVSLARATRITAFSLAPPTITNGVCNISFTNIPGGTFRTLATTNVSLPLSSWTILGSATEITPGHFTFTDPSADSQAKFYEVISP